MKGLVHQIGSSLRLYLRNTMGMIYGYIFPSIFLAAFWVLYRFDRVPLIRHMGELLTVTVLGGACFGLPTTLVSERERGVWRRYRLTPMPTGMLVTGTVAARFVILMSAGFLQVALAMLVGMPLPQHPIALAVAFTFVSFAFLGLGLVIAMMADNVPAVQALGQCIFLPMLIIGGVAVPLASLPAWAQHISAFFPGRYAVEAIQATVTNTGLAPARFDLVALALIGAAGVIVGGRMFRWDSEQRFGKTGGAGWIAVALASWVAVGVLAEARGHVAIPVIMTAQTGTPSATPSYMNPSPTLPSAPAPAATAPSPPATPTPAAPAMSAVPQRLPAPAAKSGPSGTSPTKAASTTAPAAPPAAPAATHASTPTPATAAPASPSPASPTSPASAAPAAPAAPANGASDDGLPKIASWHEVTLAMINDTIDFTHVRPDTGVVTPIAASADQPDQDTADQLAYIKNALAAWPPTKVADPLQRVRNELYVAASADVLEVPLESFLPQIVFAQLQHDVPKDDLIKILFWIAIPPHMEEGDDSAILQIRALGFQNVPDDREEVRDRVAGYAVKLLGRLTGNIKQQ